MILRKSDCAPYLCLVALAVTAGAAGCGEKKDCALGTEGCACTSSRACDPGLACSADTCIAADPGAGTAGTPPGGTPLPGGPGGGMAGAPGGGSGTGPGGMPGGPPAAAPPTGAGAAGHAWCQSVGGRRTAILSGLKGVWAAGPNDVWFVQNEPRVVIDFVARYPHLVHWDGSTFCRTDLDTLIKEGDPRYLEEFWEIWGSSERDIWATGKQGMALHWDGQAWKLVETGTQADLVWVIGSRPDNVFAVGGGVHRWDGTKWSPFPTPGVTGVIFDLWIDSRERPWLLVSRNETCVVYLFENGKGTCQLAPTRRNSYYDLDGAGETPWVLVDADDASYPRNFVLEQTGGTWKLHDLTTPDPDDPYAFSEMRVFSARDVWLAGRKLITRWDGQAWGKATVTNAMFGSAQRLWGRSSSDLYVLWGNVFADEIFHWDGRTWRQLQP
jgi:hypothetical protein